MIRAINNKNYMTWFEFWYPAKNASLNAEKSYNDKVFEYNKIQDDTEYAATLKLTKMDNIKIIVIAILIVFAIYIFKKHK